jgi:two-component system LytT family response regulator
MNKLRALIIDDEPLARQRIRHLARDISNLEIIAECANAPDGLAAIRRDAPHLLFLDIQMPEMDGFQLLSEIPTDQLPAIVFTTAYDKHALRAFETHALDYLLKPIQPDRFQAAVARAREHLDNKQASATVHGLLALLAEKQSSNPPSQKPKYLSRLTIKNEDKVIIVKTGDIDFIESAGNYVALHSGRDAHILRETLNALESQLDPEQFLRVSRSAIVNLDRVKELQPMFKGEHIIVLQTGQRLTMSRSLLRDLEDALKFR